MGDDVGDLAAGEGGGHLGRIAFVRGRLEDDLDAGMGGLEGRDLELVGGELRRAPTAATTSAASRRRLGGSSQGQRSEGGREAGDAGSLQGAAARQRRSRIVLLVIASSWSAFWLCSENYCFRMALAHRWAARGGAPVLAFR